MTTVVNGGGDGSSSAVGVIVGVLLVVVVAGLFFVYGLPAIRGNKQNSDPAQINVQLPAPAGNNGGATQPAN